MLLNSLDFVKNKFVVCFCCFFLCCCGFGLINSFSMGSIAVVTFLHLVLSCSHAVFEAYVCLFLFGRDGSTAMTRSSHQNVVKKKSTLLLPSL